MTISCIYHTVFFWNVLLCNRLTVSIFSKASLRMYVCAYVCTYVMNEAIACKRFTDMQSLFPAIRCHAWIQNI